MIGKMNAYVFVVCGAKEHIETLHVAIQALKNRTENEILVVTDKKRNGCEILAENIVNIDVPSEFNHHQAAIILKTSLHRILPKGKLYLYLDTDVLAIGNRPDDIFTEYISPIRFAADHCRLRKFSPYSVSCLCLEKFQKNEIEFHRYHKLLENTLNKYDKNREITNPELIEKATILKQKLSAVDEQPLAKILTALKFNLSGNNFRFSNQFLYDKKNKVWKDINGEPLWYEVPVSVIEKETGLVHGKNSEVWLTHSGENIFENTDGCDHMQLLIKEKFNIEITEKNWQHWNGGVFLFSDESYEFMESWYQKCLQIFKDPKWKTRDQGTLVATVWEFGLQNHQVLDKKWNLIADYNNLQLEFGEDKKSITMDGKYFEELPEFIHIYHHFGDESWKVWNDVISMMTSKNAY